MILHNCTGRDVGKQAYGKESGWGGGGTERELEKMEK